MSFGSRQTIEAQGVDIGVDVPSCLLSDSSSNIANAPEWGSRVREGVTNILQEWGCVLLRGALMPTQVQSIREGLSVPESDFNASQVGCAIRDQDKNVQMWRYTFGRLHCLLRGSKLGSIGIRDIHIALAPLIFSYSQAVANGEQMFLSEVQLIVTDPNAEKQFWHLDSAGSGLSVFIPLAPVRADLGPQHVLPGSHALSKEGGGFFKGFIRCVEILAATRGAASASPEGGLAWNAGDALLLDSRLLHRGLSSLSLTVSVPILIVRYDPVGAPPPNCGRHWMRFCSWMGSALENAFWFYRVC